MSAEKITLETPEGHILRGLYSHTAPAENEFDHPVEMVDVPLMIMAHGFPHSHMQAHKDLFGRLDNICRNVGIHTLRFDFCGSGTSDGKAEDFTLAQACANMELALTFAQEAGYKRIMMTAEGLGAIPAIRMFPATSHALALLWPVLDTRDYAQTLVNEKAAVSDELMAELNSFDIAPILGRIKAPTLILQGALDERVPIEHLDLARAWLRNRRIEITTYHDGTHALPKDNHRKFLYYHYQQFLRKYV